VAGGVQQGCEGTERGGDELPAAPLALYTFSSKKSQAQCYIRLCRRTPCRFEHPPTHWNGTTSKHRKHAGVSSDRAPHSCAPRQPHIAACASAENHTLGERGAPTSRMSSTGVLRPPDANYITGNLQLLRT
jgi:hypothetical protein